VIVAEPQAGAALEEDPAMQKPSPCATRWKKLAPKVIPFPLGPLRDAYLRNRSEMAPRPYPQASLFVFFDHRTLITGVISLLCRVDFSRPSASLRRRKAHGPSHSSTATGYTGNVGITL